MRRGNDKGAHVEAEVKVGLVCVGVLVRCQRQLQGPIQTTSQIRKLIAIFARTLSFQSKSARDGPPISVDLVLNTALGNETWSGVN